MEIPLTYKIPRVPEPLNFDWVAVDREWPVLEFTVTPEDVQRWADLHDDHNPWYFGDSPWGGPIAPNYIFYYPGQNAFAPRRDFAGVLAGLGLDALAPVPVGAKLTATTRIVDRWRRKDRGFCAYELDVRHGDTPVARARRTWALSMTPEQMALMPERPSSTIADEQPELEQLEPVTLELTIERLRDFEGPGERGSHTDYDIARAQGLPAPLAQGELSVATVCRMMANRFGAGWQVGGSMDVKVIRSSYAGESVTAQGAIVERKDGRAICRVSVVGEGSALTVVGTASAREA